MPENAAINVEFEELALTDRHLVSLYLQYPDMEQSEHDPQDEVHVDPQIPITTSSPESSPQSTKIYSSPLPDPTRYDSPASSPLSPPDSIPFPSLPVVANEQDVDDLTAQFDLALKSDEIPKRTAKYLAELKSILLTTGSTLFSASGEISTDPVNLWRVKSAACWVVLSLNHARTTVQQEIDAVKFILELAPFTVRPSLEDLWTNYKQMAELIIE
jgi:hypothetical protein